MEIIAMFVGIVGGFVGIYTTITSEVRWKKVNKKVTMIEDAESVFETIPTWYSKRMFTDHWLFGLHMQDGSTFLINTIDGVSSDGKWMDVQLAEPYTQEDLKDKCKNPIAAIADDRTSASIQVNAIVAAYELATS